MNSTVSSRTRFVTASNPRKIPTTSLPPHSFTFISLLLNLFNPNIDLDDISIIMLKNMMRAVKWYCHCFLIVDEIVKTKCSDVLICFILLEINNGPC